MLPIPVSVCGVVCAGDVFRSEEDQNTSEKLNSSGASSGEEDRGLGQKEKILH